MGALIGFIAGITLCGFLPTLLHSTVLFSISVFFSVAWRIAPKKWAQVCVFLLCLTLGLSYATWRAHLRLEQSLTEQWENQWVSMVIMVRDFPVITEYGTRIYADVESVAALDFPQLSRVRLSTYQAQPWPSGSRWQVTARLKTRHSTANPFGFDNERSMWAHGHLASGTIKKQVKRLAEANDAKALIDRLRARLAQRITAVLGHSRAAALLSALTVGEQQRISRQDWQLFAHTGITHLVSISGVHISMVAALVALLARAWLRRWPSKRLAPRVLIALAALSAAGAYSLLAGWSVPTQRTFFMLAVVATMLLWRRALSSFQILWLALATVLLLDPFAIFLPGLWLSFGLVAALMTSSVGLRRPLGRWRSAWAAQWASSFFSIATLAGFFGFFPLMSPCANLFAIPWISLFVAPLALIALAIPIDGLLQLAAWLTSLFYWVIELMAAGPAWTFPGLPWPLLLLGLIGAVWLIFPRGTPGRYFGALAILPLFFYQPPRPSTGAFWVNVLDVGQGLSVLVRTAKHTLLYDTGALPANQVVNPQLTGYGIKQLDALMLSHNDADHDHAAPEIIQFLPVKTLWVGQQASASGNQAQLCAAGQSWQWDEVRFDILAPLAQQSFTGNNPYSCVLKIQGMAGSVLLTGDIPSQLEGRLVEHYGQQLSSDILFAAHHGSKTSSSLKFLQAVNPRWAIVSAGYRNRYGHPHESVLARLQAQGIEVWRTDQAGALSLFVEPTGVHIEGFRQQEARYWRPR